MIIPGLSNLSATAYEYANFKSWFGFRQPLIIHNVNEEHLGNLKKILNIAGYQSLKEVKLNFLKSEMMYSLTKFHNLKYPCAYFCVPNATCEYI